MTDDTKILETGDIMAIQRLRMAQDGLGVSTLVGFFDCPLKCKYCINNKCHRSEIYRHFGLSRGEYTPEELLKVLEKDEIYYLMTGGGVVFGGGEPLLQSEFIHQTCELIGSKWAKRIETSLNVPWRNIEHIIGDIDEWIIDIKDLNNLIYKEYTGANNITVKRNLLKLKKLVPKDKLHIRVPRIPNFNTQEDVEESVKWVRAKLGVEPEVFCYRINNSIDDYGLPPWMQRRKKE